MPARSPRSPRRDADGRATRDRLIDAAADLFNSVGYYGTDSNRIARAAGFAPATFYKHFGDKRAVFLAAYERWVDAEWAQIRTGLGQPAERGSVAAVTRQVVAHHARWAEFRRNLRALAVTDPAVRAFRIAQRRRQLEFAEELVTLAGGSATRADLLVVALVFERLCDALADGEVAALGVAEPPVVARLEMLLRWVGGLRDDPPPGARGRAAPDAARRRAATRARRRR